MNTALVLALIPAFLCWGSFLNSLGYRLIHEVNLLVPRSFCPHCKHIIAWYDNIPLLSWLLLYGACRACKKPISWLYPFIEFFTAVVFTLLFMTADSYYIIAYFFFFSALIVTIRTDLETMLISRFVTLFIVPSGWLFSALGYLPLSFLESVLGSFFGYFFLYTLASFFKWLSGKEGMGEGDFELLAFIGAFIGFMGCWITLLISSLLGCFAGLSYYLIKRPSYNIRIPYGPFLALAAMVYVLYHQYLLNLLFDL